MPQFRYSRLAGQTRLTDGQTGSRQTDRQTDGRQADWQTDRRTDRQADKLDRLSISTTVGCAFAEAQSGNRTPYRADMLDKAGRK